MPDISWLFFWLTFFRNFTWVFSMLFSERLNGFFKRFLQAQCRHRMCLRLRPLRLQFFFAVSLLKNHSPPYSPNGFALWINIAKTLPKHCQKLPKSCQNLAKILPQSFLMYIHRVYTYNIKNNKKRGYSKLFK